MKRFVSFNGLWITCLLIGTLINTCAARLDALPLLEDYTSHRISSYDRGGGNADCLSGTTGTVTLAEIAGPGAITHIWFTINSDEQYHLRKLVLRMYWDGETMPSVESPIGDFFGLGHGIYYHYYSEPISIGTSKGLSCFWLMPFSRSAKITLTNEGEETVKSFYYYIDYRQYDEGSTGIANALNSMGRFHAWYNQQMPTIKDEDYTILDAGGSGKYVGCNLSIELNSDGWWGEGDDKIYIDNDTTPTLIGTGSEDYFCGAWCYGEPFYSPYFGCPLRGRHAKGALWNVYRYHIQDPIAFKQSIKVDIEAIHSNNPQDPPDNYSSVAYWYQNEPHKPFPDFPSANERLPRQEALMLEITEPLEAEDLPVVAASRRSEYSPQGMSTFMGIWSNNTQLFFRGNAIGDSITLEFDIPEKGLYELLAYFTLSYDYAIFDVFVNKHKINKYPIDGYYITPIHSRLMNLGEIKLNKGKHTIKFIARGANPHSTGYFIGIDCFKFLKIEEKPKTDEIIVDNRDSRDWFTTEGSWNVGVGGEDYDKDVSWAVKGTGDSTAIWQPVLPESGTYRVFMWHGADPNNDHATNAPVTIKHKKGEETITVNFKEDYGQWNLLGEYKFKKGSDNYVKISNDADGNVLADAVKFVRKSRKHRFIFF